MVYNKNKSLTILNSKHIYSFHHPFYVISSSITQILAISICQSYKRKDKDLYIPLLLYLIVSALSIVSPNDVIQGRHLEYGLKWKGLYIPYKNQLWVKILCVEFFNMSKFFHGPYRIIRVQFTTNKSKSFDFFDLTIFSHLIWPRRGFQINFSDRC
jgi:hypothetical protein